MIVHRRRFQATAIATVAIPFLIWYGQSNGLSAAALSAVALSLLLTAIVLRRAAPDARRRLASLSIVAAGSLLTSARALLGRHDLDNVPQGFLLPFSSYNRAAIFGSVGVALTLATYLLLDMLRVPGPERPYRNPTPSVVRAFFWLSAAFIGARGMLLFGVGLGSKAVGSPFPGSGILHTALVQGVRLTVLSLAVSAAWSNSRRTWSLVVRLVAVDTAISILGGNRGAIFFTLALLAGARLSAKPITYRPSARALTVLAVLPLLIYAVTRIAVVQRASLTGGIDFGVGEFLSLRISGMNRLGPVFDADLVVGWRTAVLRTNELINERIYGIIGSRSESIGVGAPATGIGYLAAGTTGVYVVSVGIGVVARILDAFRRRAASALEIAVYVSASLTFLQAIQGLRFVVQVREALVLAVMWLLLRIFVVGGGPKRPAHRALEQTPV